MTDIDRLELQIEDLKTEKKYLEEDCEQYQNDIDCLKADLDEIEDKFEKVTDDYELLRIYNVKLERIIKGYKMHCKAQHIDVAMKD